jgi:hypothetical protein
MHAMGRAGATLAAAVALASLALAPAAMTAAAPKQGRFWNHSQSKGLYLETTRHTVKTLWLFCRSPRYDHSQTRPELRASRYEVPVPLHVHRDGSFSYKGRSTRYGAESQPVGHRWKIRVSGRFTSRTHVRIKRTLQGCGSRTVAAFRERGL